MELILLYRILIFVSILPCKCVNSLFFCFCFCFFFLLLNLFCVNFFSSLCVFYLQLKKKQKKKNNASKHFLSVESFRDKQKICLNLVRRGQDFSAILPMGSGRP